MVIHTRHYYRRGCPLHKRDFCLTCFKIQDWELFLHTQDLVRQVIRYKNQVKALENKLSESERHIKSQNLARQTIRYKEQVHVLQSKLAKFEGRINQIEVKQIGR